LILYRFAQPSYATREQAFSGEGGLRYAGRWNSAGTLIIYAATTLSLAVLEIFVHVRRPIPRSLPLFVADIPNRLIKPLSPIPPMWDTRPPSASSREAGDKWLESNASVGLLVPSVIVPQEDNCLINPAHPEFSLEWIEGPFDFPLDPRIRRFLA
jgi:RES domain-containing protein